MLEFKVVNNEELLILEDLAKAIWRECYTSLLGDEQVEYMIENFQSKEAFLSQLDNGYEYYFLESCGNTIGYMGICQEVSRLFLSKLYLIGAQHRRGLGQKALQKLREIAIERNLSEIYLTVNKGNEKAIKAYERFGFVKTDDIVTDIGNGFVMDDFVYTYNICIRS